MTDLEIFLEIYLGCSLFAFGFLGYKYRQIKKLRDIYKTDLSEISYWLLEHNYDISNGIRDDTKKNMDTYSYKKIIDKAKNYYHTTVNYFMEEQGF